MKIPVIALASALLIAACSGSPTDPDTRVALGSQFRIRFGDSVTIGGTTRITFADVNDSRCPATVVCVWAGDAAISLLSGADTATLHTSGVAGSASARIGDTLLTLEAVEPDRREPADINKSAYVATLRAERAR